MRVSNRSIIGHDKNLESAPLWQSQTGLVLSSLPRACNYPAACCVDESNFVGSLCLPETRGPGTCEWTTANRPAWTNPFPRVTPRLPCSTLYQGAALGRLIQQIELAFLVQLPELKQIHNQSGLCRAILII